MNIPDNCKLLGKYLNDFHKDALDYIITTFEIRAGLYGKFNNESEMSSIIFKKFGSGLTNPNSLIFKLTNK